MLRLLAFFGGALFGRRNFALAAVLLTAAVGLAGVFLIAAILKWLVDNELWIHFIIVAGLLLAWLGRVK